MLNKMQWDLLCSLQGSDKPLKTSQIARRVKQHHTYKDDKTFYEVIRRDLNKLISVTGAIKKEKVKDNAAEQVNERHAYSWNKQGTEVFAKTLSSAQSVALGVLQKVGLGMLPPGVFEELKPLFSVIHKQEIVKDQVGSSEGRNVSAKAVATAEEKWLKKIEFMSETIGFLPQEVDSSIEKLVYESLFKENLIEVEYINIEGKKHESVVKPLALIQRGVRRYLICVPDFSDGTPVRLLMTRITRVKEVHVKDYDDIKGGEDFEIKEYLKRGLAHPRFDTDDLGLPIKLKIWVNEGTYSWLKETPIGEGQTAKDTDNGFIVDVQTTLREELVYWILSMSDNVRVLEPKILVDRVKSDLKNSLARYG